MRKQPINQHHLELVLAMCRYFLRTHVTVRKVLPTASPHRYRVSLAGIPDNSPKTAHVAIYSDKEVFLGYGCATMCSDAETLKDFIVPGQSFPVQCGTTVPASREAEE
jgi:hypothetical protein